MSIEERLNALIDVRAAALGAFRDVLAAKGYTEVSTASLVNVAGSCENPHLAFRVPYYGEEAYLAQSAQLQLEPIVMRLRRPVYTVNSSFRAEDYRDPEVSGRVLSEFTLIEPEGPTEGASPEEALEELMQVIEGTVRDVTLVVTDKTSDAIGTLGGAAEDVRACVAKPFERVHYADAVQIISEKLTIAEDADLGMREEAVLLRYFGGRPVFVHSHPSKVRFFNMKRKPEDRSAYSADLLLPPMGECVGGGLREESLAQIRRQLVESRVGSYLDQQNISLESAFGHYWAAFDEDRAPSRGGFGVGFERFVAFLLGSSDILETVFAKPLNRRWSPGAGDDGLQL